MIDDEYEFIDLPPLVMKGKGVVGQGAGGNPGAPGGSGLGGGGAIGGGGTGGGDIGGGGTGGGAGGGGITIPPETDFIYEHGVDSAPLSLFSGTRIYGFRIPENCVAVAVQIIGSTLDTNGTFYWQFPDGRRFPETGTWGILGPGTESINWHIRSQMASYAPNIPDIYVPAGVHLMTLSGHIEGSMGITFA